MWPTGIVLCHDGRKFSSSRFRATSLLFSQRQSAVSHHASCLRHIANVTTDLVMDDSDVGLRDTIRGVVGRGISSGRDLDGPSADITNEDADEYDEGETSFNRRLRPRMFENEGDLLRRRVDSKGDIVTPQGPVPSRHVRSFSSGTLDEFVPIGKSSSLLSLGRIQSTG